MVRCFRSARERAASQIGVEVAWIGGHLATDPVRPLEGLTLGGQLDLGENQAAVGA